MINFILIARLYKITQLRSTKWQSLLFSNFQAFSKDWIKAMIGFCSQMFTA